jgi:hypothetical protein
MTPKGSCTECLVPSWWCYFGRLWKFGEVWPNWRKKVTGGMPFKVIPCPQSLCSECFLSAIRWKVLFSIYSGSHDVSPVHGATQQWLNPLRPQTKIYPSSRPSLRYFGSQWLKVTMSPRHLAPRKAIFYKIPWKSNKMAFTCNTSYLGGGNWEDYSSRSAWEKSETPFQPIAGYGGACLSSQLCGKHK